MESVAIFFILLLRCLKEPITWKKVILSSFYGSSSIHKMLPISDFEHIIGYFKNTLRLMFYYKLQVYNLVICNFKRF